MRIVVDDDGPGIPEADLERVFEPFVRLEGSRSRETGGAGPRPCHRPQHLSRAWRRRDAGEPAGGRAAGDGEPAAVRYARESSGDD